MAMELWLDCVGSQKFINDTSSGVEQLRIKAQHDADPNDEVSDERTRPFDGTTRGAAIQLERLPCSSTNYFETNWIGSRSLRIDLRSARIRAVPILAPFPNISLHVVE